MISNKDVVFVGDAGGGANVGGTSSVGGEDASQGRGPMKLQRQGPRRGHWAGPAGARAAMCASVNSVHARPAAPCTAPAPARAHCHPLRVSGFQVQRMARRNLLLFLCPPVAWVAQSRRHLRCNTGRPGLGGEV